MSPLHTLSRFLFLPELKLLRVESMDRSGAVYHLVKESPFEVCPKCASRCSSIYDHRIVKIRDEPVRGKLVIMKIKKRRFWCRECKKPFTEPIGGIRKSGRTTDRFRRALTWAAENFVDLKRVQEAFRCSRGLVYKAVYEQLELKRRTRLYPFPKIIGIDEHSFRKPKYEPVEYASVIVDHKNKRLFEVIDGRDQEALSSGSRHLKGKEQVQVVTLDLSNTFRSFCQEEFPNARLVADRFHVQRSFCKLVNKFRRRVTGDKRSHPMRKLLLREGRKLKGYQRRVISQWLNQFPDLREVYMLKEAVHRFYRIKGTKRARLALIKILDHMGKSKLKEVRGLRKIVLGWKEEILGYFIGRHSNGRVEGFNRKAKLVQRRAFGYRSFKNYRLSLLNACRGRRTGRYPL